MTATAAPSVLRLRVDILVSPVAVAPIKPLFQSRGRRSLVVFVALLLVVNAALALVLDRGPPHLRDPEYGLRLQALRKKLAEQPHRPLTVVLGSSRTAMGIRPDVYESSPEHPESSPLLFNMSMTGGGPILQLLTLRRLLNDGICPDAVLLEFWPALMRGDGEYREERRIDVQRLRTDDGPTVNEFFADPASTQQRVNAGRAMPLWYHRRSIMNRLWPEAVWHHDRTDATWAELDEWGWLPGRISATTELRERGWPQVAKFYEPLFQTYEISPLADRALRSCIALSRDRGTDVKLISLPETARFRSMMTPESVRASEDYCTRLIRDQRVPYIDGRTWADDADLPDGFHLTRSGAAAFTRRIAPIVALPRNSP